MELLGNSVFLGLIAALTLLAAVIALAIPIVIHLKEKNKKELSCSVFDNVPLLNIKEAVKENFQVLYRGQSIPDAHFVSIMVQNTGNVPIEQADFVTPLKLNFGNDSNIFFAVTTTWPPELVDELNNSKEKSYVQFKPLLMNKGALFSISVMVANFQGRVKVEGLIKGVKIIYAIPESNPLPKYWKPLVLSSFAVTALAFALEMLLTYDQFYRPSYFINSMAHLQNQFSLYSFILFLIFILSSGISIAVWLSPKFTPFKIKDDDSLLKRVFGLLPTEAELNRMIEQHQKSSNGQPYYFDGRRNWKITQDKK